MMESAVAFALSLSAVETLSLGVSRALHPVLLVSVSEEATCSNTTSTISSISDSLSQVGLICLLELGQLLYWVGRGTLGMLWEAEEVKLKSRGTVLVQEGYMRLEVFSGSKKAVGLLMLPRLVSSRKG